LNGKFAQASSVEIPLHSFAFLGIRVAAVTAILMISLLAERFFILRDIQFVNTKLIKIMKTEALSINGRLQRALVANPRPVLDALIKSQRGIRQEISTIDAAIQIKALSPLVQISQLASSTQSTLTEFKTSDMSEIKATFTAETADELNNLKANLERRSTFSDISINIDQTKLQLVLTATGN
jgi:hypothetical protein